MNPDIKRDSGMFTAPIVLFVFNRPEHTSRTLDALRSNLMAEESDLIIYSDGARKVEQANNVQEVRKVIRSISGFRSIRIIERSENFGLARSIIDGVSAVVNEHGRVIVLEDDLVTSPYFLTYMNQALEKFASVERVASVHGYVYPVQQPLPEAFFLCGADCWGWGTWRRAWTNFNPDGRHLLAELRQRELLDEFDFNGAYGFSEMLEGQICGKNDSWAIRWHASAFLANMLTLYPGRSLVHNAGNDDSGTHCGETNRYDAALSATPIDLSNTVVKPSEEGRRVFEEFFRSCQSSRHRMLDRPFSRRAMKLLKSIAGESIKPAMAGWARRLLRLGRS